MGSSCRNDGRPHTATRSSMLGQRRAGSFSNIRMTAAARLGGQSGRSSVTGRAGSLKCAYITDMIDSPWNGSLAVSISYATTPSEYWSEADRKSTRLNSSHSQISYAVFCLKKKKHTSDSSHSQISYAVFCLKKKKVNDDCIQTISCYITLDSQQTQSTRSSTLYERSL